MMTWDFFISDASEDKTAVAKPLADILQAGGFKVWYDEYTLSLGDNLRRSIEQGLAASRYGIVVLSPSFFAKKWPQLELDGLFALERPDEKKILPIWHGVTAADVERFSSFMAMRLGVSTSEGMDRVVGKIVDAVHRAAVTPSEPSQNAFSPQLHPHSIALLQAAFNSNGEISTIWHLGGFSVSVGGIAFGAAGDPRNIALNLHCLDELLNNGLAERKSESLLVLTQEGFDYRLPSDVLEAPRPLYPTLTPANDEVAKQIMHSAACGDGRIHSLAHLAGRVLQAGSFRTDSGGDRRTEARWQSVLNELELKGLLLRRSSTAYLVTHLGFLWSDAANAADKSKTIPR
jgi:hypothetical protein